jgi:hypothetical protein
LTSAKVNGVALPDARLNLWGRRNRTDVLYHGKRYDRAYCVNCGADGGAFLKGSTFTFYLCDDCVETHGVPPGVIEVPEAEVR